MRRTARTAAYAVAPATNSEPATSQETSDGLAVNWFAGTVTYSAWLDRRLENPMTSSPTAKPVTPEPSSATTPARSLPCPDGNVAGNRSCTAPARMAASLILMPAALTSTRTSSAAGTGRGRSRTSRTSTPPYESNCTALGMSATIIDLRDVSISRYSDRSAQMDQRPGVALGTHFRPLVGHHRFRGDGVIQLAS